LNLWIGGYLENNNDDTWEDPIVAEVRAIRDAHARQFNYDLDAIFADILQGQEELKRQGYKFVTVPLKQRCIDEDSTGLDKE
jgi:hypothetical protein